MKYEWEDIEYNGFPPLNLVGAYFRVTVAVLPEVEPQMCTRDEDLK